jgi:hypothetical protein
VKLSQAIPGPTICPGVVGPCQTLPDVTPCRCQSRRLVPALPVKAPPLRPDRPVLLVVRGNAGRILILRIVRKTTAIRVRPDTTSGFQPAAQARPFRRDARTLACASGCKPAVFLAAPT